MPLSLDQQMEAVSRRFEELAHRLNQPETAADPAAFRRLMQEYHEAEPAVTAYRALRTERDHLAQAKALLAGDEALEPDFKQMIQQEICEKTQSSSRCAAGWAARRPPSLPTVWCGCTACTPPPIAGRWSCST